jgi:hypothetical protein
MTRNVFEQQNGGEKDEETTLSHDALKGIVSEARKSGSLKEAFEAYAFKHGIENIDVLFPEARNVTDTPEFDSRRIEWVTGVLDATRKDPMGALEGAGIRSILHDHDLYAAVATVDDGATSTEAVDAIVNAMSFYKGSGSPVFYTTLPVLTKLLLTRDQFMHRLWKTPGELASELGVSAIVTVEVMESEPDLIGIVVNLRDYTIGTDKGGDVNFFDDFDIDYNQYKYLYETRLSGALTKMRSAVVIKRAVAGSTLRTPEKPDFDGTTVIVKTTTGVTYKNKETGATMVTGTPVAVAEGDTLTVEAHPASGTDFFASNQDDEWTFKNQA